jgi:hypothetical protein
MTILLTLAMILPLSARAASLADAQTEAAAAVAASHDTSREGAAAALAALAAELRGHELEVSSLRAELRALTAAAPAADEQDRHLIGRFPRDVESLARSLALRADELRAVSSLRRAPRAALAVSRAAARLESGVAALDREAAAAATAFAAAGLGEAAAALDVASGHAVDGAAALKTLASRRR